MPATTTPARDHNAEKARSYAVRQQLSGAVNFDGPIPAGTKVRTLADCYYCKPIPAGTILTNLTTSNAGFRGIEVMGRDATGAYVITSAGNVEVVR